MQPAYQHAPPPHARPPPPQDPRAQMGGNSYRGPAPPPPQMQAQMPPPPMQDEYRSGGEAGMAGVGRRAFQAAARAAMWAQAQAQQQPVESPVAGPSAYGGGYDFHGQMRAEPAGYGHDEARMKTPVPGMDGRRANAPPHLEIEQKAAAGARPISRLYLRDS
jgi:PDZ and LIM domain protein 5/6/7